MDLYGKAVSPNLDLASSPTFQREPSWHILWKMILALFGVTWQMLLNKLTTHIGYILVDSKFGNM
jgi:hypothetical protein